MLGDDSHDDIKHFFMVNVEFDVMFVLNLLFVIYVAVKKLDMRKEKMGRAAVS